MHLDLTLNFPPWTWLALLAVAALLLARHLLRLWRDTWAYYLAVFHLKQIDERDGLHAWASWWGYREVLPRGLWLDWYLNQWLTFFFLDPPHHPLELVTGRLQRYVNPQVPELPADAPRWLQLLWPARMGWWHVHAAWWQWFPYRRRLADQLAHQLLDQADPPEHVDREEGARA